MPAKFVKARLALAAAAAAPVFTFFATAADGQTFTVTSNADTNTSGTLPYAINQANSYGGAATINFSSSLGTIQLTSDLPTLNNSGGITINGNGNSVAGVSGADSYQPDGFVTVVGATAGDTAFTLTSGNLTLLTGTTVSGGSGGNDYAGAEVLGVSENLSGGAGIALESSGTLSNAGQIVGGTGGANGSADGGAGGAGVVAGVANATVANTGIVAGGNGGGGPGSGGNGGAGMQFNAFGSVINSGAVSGGNGAQVGPGNPGGGGAGVNFGAGGSLDNSGTITGGSGNNGTDFYSGANGGNAVSFSGGGSVINSGTITGGAAGGASDANPAGSAGAAIAITGGVGTFTNQIYGEIHGDVTLDNYANSVTLQIGSSITGNLNAGTSTLSTLTLTDNGTSGIGTYSTAVGSTQFSGQLIKSGGGEWVMDQTLGYLGGTVLNAGTLSVSQDANLGDPSGTLTFNGGVLQITGTSFTSTARTINWGSSGGGFDINNAANTFTVAQTLAGYGGLTKFGAGTLVLTAQNTFTGGTTVNAGMLVVGDGTDPAALAGLPFYLTPFQATGNVGVLVNAGGSLLVMANASITASGGGDHGGTGGAGVSFTSAGSLTNRGTITGGQGGLGADSRSGNGGAGVSFANGGSLTNSGSISGGSIGIDQDLGSGSTGQGVVFTGAAGTLINQYGGSISNGVFMGNYANAVTLQIGSSITGGLNVGTSSLSTLTLTDNGSGGTQNYSAAVDSTTFNGSLIKNGSGTWVLDQAMNYPGGTTINAGTLQVSGSGSGTTTMGSGPVTVNAGGTLAGTNQDAFGYAGFAAPGTITINGGTVTDLGTSNYRVTLPNLIFTGGTLTSAAGNVGDQYGNFSLYGNGGSASVVTNASATTATISAASIAVEVPTTFTAAAGATPSSVDLLVSSNLNGTFGSYGITKAGPGTMELTGSNTYSGPTTINAGTLAISGSIASNTVTVDGSSNFASLKLMSATALSNQASLIVNTPDSPTIVLDFNGNQTVLTWQINGIYVQPGIYSTSNEPAQDPGLLTSDMNDDGTLTVAAPEPSMAGAGLLAIAGLTARRRRRSNR